MNIDLTYLLNNSKSFIDINENFNIDLELLKNTNIIKLKDTYFTGTISYDLNILKIIGSIIGTMTLKDDLTLDEIDHSFDIKIDEYFESSESLSENNLKIINNSLDLIPFLWQNILLEVPLKVSNKKNTNLPKGNDWRVISEDELKVSNNSLSELQNLLEKREE